jgi:hypothetical protein
MGGSRKKCLQTIVSISVFDSRWGPAPNKPALHTEPSGEVHRPRPREFQDRTLDRNREAILQSLRNLLCHAQTEKTASVLKRAGVKTDKTKGGAQAESGRSWPCGAEACRRAHDPFFFCFV